VKQAFFSAWHTYQTIILHDYMYHKQIITCLKQELQGLRKLSILDLGCGDAYVVAQAVQPAQVSRYLGLEASAEAIVQAKKNLAAHGAGVTLLPGDMVDHLATISGKFDVAIAGYSLHHWQALDQRQVMAAVAERLKPDGLFLFYDLMTRPAEDRGTYNRRACQLYRSSWSALSPVEIEHVVTHVMENDYPQPQEFHRAALRLAGFQPVHLAFQDQDDLFALFVARKASAGV
jgi:SAM-dependent methyltransferase